MLTRPHISLTESYEQCLTDWVGRAEGPHGRHGAPKWPRRDRVIGRGYAERPSASHGELDARIEPRVNLLVLYFVYS